MIAKRDDQGHHADRHAERRHQGDDRDEHLAAFGEQVAQRDLQFKRHHAPRGLAVRRSWDSRASRARRSRSLLVDSLPRRTRAARRPRIRSSDSLRSSDRRSSDSRASRARRGCDRSASLESQRKGRRCPSPQVPGGTTSLVLEQKAAARRPSRRAREARESHERRSRESHEPKAQSYECNSHAARARISGNRMTSRIVGEFVSSITSRSMPIPSPPAGGRPYSSARM